MTRGFIGYATGKSIRGWEIQDAQPELAGALLLAKFHKHSVEEIRNFFLNIIDLRPNHLHPALSAQMIFETDWVSQGKLCVSDSSTFIRDPVLCEFGYVFDLECPVKLLRLFSGFGKDPTKGYSNYRWRSQNDNTTYYMNVVTRLVCQSYDEMYIKMLAAMYRCPRLTEILTDQAILQNTELWLQSRIPKTLEPNKLQVLAQAIRSYADGTLRPPAEEILKPIERPRRVLWR